MIISLIVLSGGYSFYEHFSNRFCRFCGKEFSRELKEHPGWKEPYQTDLKIDKIYEYDRENTLEELDQFCSDCDFVFNLAGVNRPKDPKEFKEGNFGFAS